MEEISIIKTYIKNNHPNVVIVENDDCLLITNNTKSKSYKKVNKKIRKRLDAEEVNLYLTEFNLKSRKIFTDMSKLDEFPEFKILWNLFLKRIYLRKKCSGVTVTEWIWEYDGKEQLFIEIESRDEESGAIFKEGEIVYINIDGNLCSENNIDENLIKRTKTFNHIRSFECNGESNTYYIKEENVHQYCLGIIDYSDSNTKYYEKERIKESKVPKHGNCLYLDYEDHEKEFELKVTTYDIANEIYRDINYGFLVKEIGDDICCYKKLVNGEEIELSESDKIICTALELTYKKF